MPLFVSDSATATKLGPLFLRHAYNFPASPHTYTLLIYGLAHARAPHALRLLLHRAPGGRHVVRRPWEAFQPHRRMARPLAAGQCLDSLDIPCYAANAQWNKPASFNEGAKYSKNLHQCLRRRVGAKSNYTNRVKLTAEIILDP